MVDMPTFARMYVDLFNAVTEAMKCLEQGNTQEAVLCLAEGQVKTIGQLME